MQDFVDRKCVSRSACRPAGLLLVEELGKLKALVRKLEDVKTTIYFILLPPLRGDHAEIMRRIRRRCPIWR